MKQRFYEDSNFWPWVLVMALFLGFGLSLPIAASQKYINCVNRLAGDYCQDRSLIKQGFGVNPPAVRCSAAPMQRPAIHYFNESEIAVCR